MSTELQDRLRLDPGAGRRARARQTILRLLPVLVVVGIVAVLAAVAWNLGSERRALRQLPEQQRLALLARTVGELRQFCGEGRPDALKKHCRELASFAAQFDECRGECEALVHREFAPAPAR